MAIQNLNNLYTPGSPRPARKRVKMEHENEVSKSKENAMEVNAEENVVSVTSEEKQNVESSLFKEIPQASSLGGEEEKNDIKNTKSLEDNKFTDGQMKALLDKEPEKETVNDDYMNDYLSRFDTGSKRASGEKETKKEDKDNIYSKIVSNAKGVNPETGQSLASPDDLLAQAMEAYSKSGKEVLKNKRDDYIAPVARGKYEEKSKGKSENKVTENKKQQNKPIEKGQGVKGQKEKAKDLEKTVSVSNKKSSSKAGAVSEVLSKTEKKVEIKANTANVNEWLVKRKENAQQPKNEEQNIIVSRETSNVKHKVQKEAKKVQESSLQLVQSQHIEEKEDILQELMGDVDVSEIIIMSSNLVQVIKWGSGIEKYTSRYASYEAFESDIKKYLVSKNIEVNWDSTYSKSTSKEGDIFTIFNKTARDGSKKVSIRIKKSKKVRYFAFNRLTKEGIQTSEMANQEVKAIQNGKSILIFGEDRIDNLTILNSIVSKIPSKDVGAMIASDSDLDYKGINVEVFAMELSQMDELDGLVEALVMSGSKWIVFDQVSKFNYNHVLNAVKSGSVYSTIACLQTSDIKKTPEDIGLSTTESRKFSNEINSGEVNCIMIKVGKDESGKLMLEQIIDNKHS